MRKLVLSALPIPARSGGGNQAAIAAHCGVANGYISILYDQSTAANFVPDTLAKQPQVYDGGTGLVLTNEHGNPAWHVSDVSEFTMSGYVYTSALYTLISAQKALADDAGMFLWRGVDTSYSIVYQASSTSGLSGNAGSPTAYINGVVLSPQNRNALHDALDTGVLTTNVLGIRSTTMIAWTLKKVFGYYSYGTAFAPVLRISDIIFWKDSEITLANLNIAAGELKTLLEA